MHVYHITSAQINTNEQGYLYLKLNKTKQYWKILSYLISSKNFL